MEHIHYLIELIKSKALTPYITDVIQTADNEVDIVLKEGIDKAEADDIIGDLQLEFVQFEPQLIIHYVDHNGIRIND